MFHITDDMVDAHVDAAQAQAVLRDAFAAFGNGEAAMQERIRTDAGGVKLSTLGAVIPGQDVAGAKVYTTIAGQFSFVILIFSARDGRPLASMDAGAITRLRTAACSVLAAQRLAGPSPRVMALFGAGTQGMAHARQLCAALPIDTVMVSDPHADADMPSRLALACGARVEVIDDANTAVRRADVVVTASRSTMPLFRGESLKPGAFVAAIGSSLPHTRELDDVALARAATVAVEWKPQSLREAGDLVQAAPGVLDGKVVELAEVVKGAVTRAPEDIVIYKSVGVGLEDIALAGLVYRRVMATRG